jgi:hypothetical protein
MRCDQCPITLVCWSGLLKQTCLYCAACGVTAVQRGDRWTLWRCPDGNHPPNAVPQSCAECNPLHWARSNNSLDHVSNYEITDSKAQKRWRSKLYRTLKQQKYERDSLEYQKRREKEARQEQLEREAEHQKNTPRGYRAPPIRSRGCRKKKSDVGRTYK